MVGLVWVGVVNMGVAQEPENCISVRQICLELCRDSVFTCINFDDYHYYGDFR